MMLRRSGSGASDEMQEVQEACLQEACLATVVYLLGRDEYDD